MSNKIKFAFFGSSRFSTIVLDELEHAGYIPNCIITIPDKPKGRKMLLAPTPVKEWAQKRNIRVYDPVKLDAELIEKLNSPADGEKCVIFIVASYGKIIPKTIIDMPKYKTLNIHPSLLPKYRGASPLEGAMLDDAKHTGVTIMRIDEEMDHGPIIEEEAVDIDEWPIYEKFEEMMAKIGGRLLVKTMSSWIAGKIKEKEQNHDQASYTKKIIKEDGFIDLENDPYLNFRKIQAFHEWPQAYFLKKHNGKMIRIKITEASFQNGKLNIKKVIPEGKKEMPYEDFERGYKKI
jgi:methionyl-tRNA formyltransferase